MNFLVGAAVIIYGILVLCILAREPLDKPIISKTFEKIIMFPVCVVFITGIAYGFYLLATKIGEAIL